MKRGRKPKEVTRDFKLNIRLTEEERDILDKKAKESGLKKAELLRKCLEEEDPNAAG